jgi:hypothetical protein
VSADNDDDDDNNNNSNILPHISDYRRSLEW